jgi:branched-chain amino acid transport system substrate-binding protein
MFQGFFLPAILPPRALTKWPCLAALVAAALVLAGCADLREVRKVFEGTQETSPAPRPPPSNPPRPPAPVADRTLPAPAPEVAAVPPVPPSGGPALGAARLPGVRLTPPPGVVPVTRVALLLPLSGPQAQIGRALLNAAQLALFATAPEGFAIMPVDTAGTPAGAEAAMRIAIEDGARLVLGPVFASSVAAAAPLARAAGLQVISFSNDRAVAGNGVYIMGFTPETQIGRITNYAAARGVKRIAAILPAGVYGDRVEAVLRAAIAGSVMTLTDAVRYAAADTNTLTPIVRRLANYDARRSVLLDRRKELEGKTDEASKRALKRLEGLDTLGDVHFDAVLMPEGISVLRALAPLLPFYDVDPRKVRMLGTVQWDDPALVTEPALFGGWFPAPPPAARAVFDGLYRKTYGDTPPRLAALAYDATALAAVLVRSRGGAEVKAAPQLQASAGPAPLPAPMFTVDALTAPNGFAGVDGIFRLLPSGLAERGLAVKEIRNRRFVIVSPAPTTFEKTPN